MAEVLVWLLSADHRSDGTKGINVGHAALLADRAKKPCYVSWWPKGSVSGHNPRTHSHSTPGFAHDVEREGGNQPRKVDLKCLDDDAISAWWDRIRATGFATPYSLDVLPKSDDYDLFLNNCSTVVSRAMMIGGANEICPFPKFDTVIPAHILTWAHAIEIAAKLRKHRQR